MSGHWLWTVLDSHLALTGRAVIVMVLDRVTPSASSHTYLVREKHWGSGSPCGRRCVRDVGLKQGQGLAFPAQSVAQVSTKARSSSIRTPSSSSLKPRNPSTTKRLPPSSPRPDSLPPSKTTPSDTPPQTNIPPNHLFSVPLYALKGPGSASTQRLKVRSLARPEAPASSASFRRGGSCLFKSLRRLRRVS